jgi:hypothetical protein
MEKKQSTTPQGGEAAQERGERVETGKTVARGGKEDGPVAGASEQKSAPSNARAEAVADAFAQLGEGADLNRVAEAIRAQTGLTISPEEIQSLRSSR